MPGLLLARTINLLSHFPVLVAKLQNSPYKKRLGRVLRASGYHPITENLEHPLSKRTQTHVVFTV